MMTKEEIIKNLEANKQKKLEELAKINAYRDALLDFIGDLHWLIDEAKKGESND